jgi:hypothetical protein
MTNVFKMTVFSKWDSAAGEPGPMTKRIHLDAEGVLQKDGGLCRMGRGSARLAVLGEAGEDGDATQAMENLAQTIDATLPHQALALGVPRIGLGDDEEVRVFAGSADDQWARAEEAAGGPRVIHRNAEEMGWNDGPGLLLFDFDMKGMPAAIAQRMEAARGLLPLLIEAVPELAGVGMVERPSTSSGLYNSETGEKYPGGGGRHVYLPVKDAADVPRTLEVIGQRLWLAGLGWIWVNHKGSRYIRTLADLAVGAPERLIFEGAPLVEPPVAQDAEARSCVVHSGEVLDTRAALPPLTAEEQARYDQMVKAALAAAKPEADAKRDASDREEAKTYAKSAGVSEEEALRHVRKRYRGFLLEHVELAFADVGLAWIDVPQEEGTTKRRSITVEDVILDAAAGGSRWLGAPLADPLEGVGYGGTTAMVFKLSDDRLQLNSFAHGGEKHILALSARRARQILEARPVEDAVGDVDWLVALHPMLLAEIDEMDALAGLIVRRGGKATTKTAVLKRVKDAADRRAAALREAVAKEERAKAQAEAQHQAKAEGAAGQEEARAEAEAALPPGYYFGADGIYRENPKGDERICSPMRFVASAASAEGEGWTLNAVFVDPAGNLHSVPIHRRDLAGDPAVVVAPLLDRGLGMGLGGAKEIHRMLTQIKPPKHVISVDRAGWVPGRSAFALPTGRVVGPDAAGVMLSRQLPDMKRRMARKGSLEGWQQNVAALARLNTRALLPVCTALSSPLLSLLGQSGSIVHLTGQSSKGKTSAQRLGSTVWGDPADGGFIAKWRATDNGLEGRLAASNDTGMILDEIRHAEPHAVERMVWMLAGGEGKQRAARSGEARATQQFRCDALSSGEVALDIYLRGNSRQGSAGGSVGHLVRMVSVPALPPNGHGVFEHLHGEVDGAAFVKRLERAMVADHGWAGPAFVEWLAGRLKDAGDAGAAFVQEEFDRAYADILAAAGRAWPGVPVGDQARRALITFARLAAAGELAGQAGILPVLDGEPTAAAAACFLAWLDDRGGVGDAEQAAAIQRVRAAVALRPGQFGRLVHVTAPRGGHVRWTAHPAQREPMLGYATTMPDGSTAWLFTTEGWAEVHRGYDAQQARKLLDEAGLLLRERGSHLAFRRRIEGQGRVYFIAVPAAVLRSRAAELEDAEPDADREDVAPLEGGAPW